MWYTVQPPAVSNNVERAILGGEWSKEPDSRGSEHPLGSESKSIRARGPRG